MKRFRSASPARRAIRSLILLSAVLGSALSGVASAAGDQVYPLGALFPLTGPNAVYGKLFSEGANLAVEHVNAGDEIDGKLKIVFADSQALPQPAVVGMNKLVNVNDVKFVLSAFSGVSQAIAPIGNRAHVLMVNGGGVSPELAIGDYFLNDIPLSDDEVNAFWPYVVNEMGAKKIAVIHVNDPFGNGVNTVIKQRCEELGCSVVSDISIDPSSTSFQSEVVKLRVSGADAIYIASYGQQQNVIAKQLRDGGIRTPLLSYSAFGIPATQKLDAAQGATYTAEHIDYDANDMTRQFLADFKNKYGEEPNYYQVNYYNAVRIYADLIAHLQDKGQAFTGENLLAALHDIGTFDVVGGEVTFRDDGTVKMPIEINRIEGGKSKILKTVELK
ncbi:ABC transporter substrate-binding protein [Salinisphaera aquimarina]|uniref:ABC transporter substrate-binding protein n=1 Tax=Salinisphaera aquimarina TaxID=2094031 RepID=A0ABV7EQ41_9GAMM